MNNIDTHLIECIFQFKIKVEKNACQFTDLHTCTKQTIHFYRMQLQYTPLKTSKQKRKIIDRIRSTVVADKINVRTLAQTLD